MLCVWFLNFYCWVTWKCCKVHSWQVNGFNMKRLNVKKHLRRRRSKCVKGTNILLQVKGLSKYLIIKYYAILYRLNIIIFCVKTFFIQRNHVFPVVSLKCNRWLNCGNSSLGFNEIKYERNSNRGINHLRNI